MGETVKTFEIIHEQEQQLFYIELDDNQKAYTKYKLLGNRQVDFYSTLVPDGHRKQGLAAKLVQRGFEWADQQELHITASCWYAAKKLAERAKIGH